MSDKPLPVEPDFNNPPVEEIVTNEIASPQPSAQVVSPAIPAGDVQTLMAVESMLKNVISRMEMLKTELKEEADMLKSAFESDPIYREFDDNAKAAAKDKLAAKKEILKKPDVADLSLKVQSKRSEIKELKEKMSDYLTQFQQLSGLNEIEGEDGEVRTIVYTARLIKQNSKFGN